jgi:transglutaminase-like putative cysteine protease
MTTMFALILAAPLQVSPAGPPIIVPEGPLQRTESVRHRFTITVTINYPPTGGTNTPWTMPLIVDGPWSAVDTAGFEVTLVAGSDQLTERGVDVFKGPNALGIGDISATIPPVQTWPLQVRVTGVATSWSSTFDDAAALQMPWPSAWPGPVSAMLKSSVLIESDSSIISETVKALTQGDVRSVPPAQAAKLIVQDACKRFKVGQGHMRVGSQSQLRGIDVQGAEAAATSGTGTPADLVCICVAMLRAGGLPSRPVIGLGSARWGGANEYGVWAEVYLPGCGWVPFDPDVLRQQAIDTLDPRTRWTGFGTLPQLQRRIALSWSFGPSDAATAFDSWAPWGWARYLPSAPFPIAIQSGAIVTGGSPVQLAPQRPVPSSIRLDRTSAP